VRQGVIKASPRTQDSIGVTLDGARWVLINASPDIRSHIESVPSLHPRAPRHTPIAAIVLTNGDLDHCLGLLSLREHQPLVVYATDLVRRGFTEHNALYHTLERFSGHVTWKTLKLGVEEMITAADGVPLGLTVTAVGVPGKVPVHLEPAMPNHPEMNTGLRVREMDRDQALVYAPGVAHMSDDVGRLLRRATCLLFDGTFWSDDELSAQGLSGRSARDLAHWPIGGPEGSLAALSSCVAPRRLYTHINNTNPILRMDAPERRVIQEAGWEVAEDGLEIEV
jgi:pyrroloquinoline quinone biosynthesis protein B